MSNPVPAFLLSYASQLAELQAPLKPQINSLTLQADQNRQFSSELMQLIFSSLSGEPRVDRRLTLIYLLDSILKNVSKSVPEYASLISESISSPFESTYLKSSDLQKKSLKKLLVLWRDGRWLNEATIRRLAEFCSLASSATLESIGAPSNTAQHQQLIAKRALAEEANSQPALAKKMRNAETQGIHNQNQQPQHQPQHQQNPSYHHTQPNHPMPLAMPISVPNSIPVPVSIPPPIVPAHISPEIHHVLQTLESSLLAFPHLLPLLFDLKRCVEAGADMQTIYSKIEALTNATQHAQNAQPTIHVPAAAPTNAIAPNVNYFPPPLAAPFFPIENRSNQYFPPNPQQPPVNQTPAPATNIPSVSSVVASLYSGLSFQCKSCGLRCSSADFLSDHLDWHFKMNKRETNKNKHNSHQQWYWTDQEWIHSADVVFGVKTENPASESQNKGEANDRDDKSAPASLDSHANSHVHAHTSKVPQSATQKSCPVCRELFVSLWDDEEDCWVFTNAILVKSEENDNSKSMQLQQQHQSQNQNQSQSRDRRRIVSHQYRGQILHSHCYDSLISSFQTSKLASSEAAKEENRNEEIPPLE